MRSLGDLTARYFNLNRVKSTGAVRSGSSSKPFGVDAIKEDWFGFTTFLTDAGVATLRLTPDKVLQEAKNHVQTQFKESLKTDVEFDAYVSTQEFVEKNLESAGIKVDVLGRVDLQNSENSLDYLHLLAEQYNRVAKANGWAPVNTGVIDKAMGNIRFNTPRKAIKDIVEKVKYDPKASDQGYYDVIKLMRPGVSNKDLDIHVSALKHYLWQIKRKLTGQKIYDPLMIYVHGNQGVGKSSLIRYLNQSILGAFYSEQDVADAVDARSTESKQNFYSILADEISYCDDATVAKVKKLLTAESEDSRVLGTNMVMKVVNNTTWAATSNHSLMSTIYDETGLRRFWEIPCTIPHGEVLQFANLEKVDVLTMWKAVDEDLNTGYYNRSLPLWKKMQEHQSKSVAKSNAHAFLYMEGFLQPDSSEYCWCKGKDLFRLYNEWAVENHVRSKGNSRIWFDRKLKQLGIQVVTHDREVYYWLYGAGRGQVEINKDNKAPITDGITVPKVEDAELQKLVNEGFNTKSSVEMMVNKGGNNGS
jgi:hypothetical protein